MERQMSATQVRVNFGEVLRYVSTKQLPIIVKHTGKPQAVLIAIEEYERLKEASQPTPDWRIALDQALQLGKAIHARRGSEPLPDAAEMIHQMREERDAQLREVCGLC
ncbi:MAG: type II toxin-antitoxin system Phd/YefM family antitoxin [Anaerolineae bacterium]